MKNSKIHENKVNAEVRDFLSLSLVKIFEDECANNRGFIEYDKDNPINWAISDCEMDIIFHQRRLELLKQKQAVIALIKMNGWQEFDVSDWVEKDMHNKYKLAIPFIGTQEEYDNLILELKTT